ncbi:dephospho-CoA kinase [Endozoicomonas sp. SCSIO W0465]|uniref:dephospho-CoA kinase n=1 Tax=Endozoicomonas sp. SCSIO W0465 TaxID=2918516 RepID=UPI0020754FC3|nr:dephospho-CoA kinase [Endozoicomonas sp. SCSIO W0465]USE37542.1 dephospho-CoA kinase [Endozoicomonas sp. SCSIO W0465]
MTTESSPQSKKKRPFTVGVTGGIGSGKTTVTDFFASHGIRIVDADIASRMVVEPGKPALADIEQRYGPEILIDGGLDRRKLRTIIFDDTAERKWLEGLLHPLIRDQITLELGDAESRYAVLVSPLMLETSQHELVDRVLVVDVPERIQLSRTMSRDQMTEEQTRQILDNQMKREQRMARADDIIDNSGSMARLHQSLDKLHQFYLSLA